MAQALESRDYAGTEKDPDASGMTDFPEPLRTAALERRVDHRGVQREWIITPGLIIGLVILTVVQSGMVAGAGIVIADNPQARDQYNRRMATAVVQTPTAQALHATATVRAATSTVIASQTAAARISNPTGTPRVPQ